MKLLCLSFTLVQNKLYADLLLNSILLFNECFTYTYVFSHLKFSLHINLRKCILMCTHISCKVEFEQSSKVEGNEPFKLLLPKFLQ